MAWAFCCSSAQLMLLVSLGAVRPYVGFVYRQGSESGQGSDLSQLRYASIRGVFLFLRYRGILMRWCVCSLYNATVLCTLRPSVVRHTCDNIYIENLMLVWSVGIWIWTPPTCKLVKLPCPTHKKYFVLTWSVYIYAVNMNSGASNPLNAQPLRLKPAPIAEAPTVGSRARALRPLPFPGLAWRATVCIGRGTLRGLRA